MSKRFRLLSTLVVPALVLSAMAAPALAKGKGSGGKKPIGTIVSFDGTTLTMEAKDGSTLVAPVSDDVQIKVQHRGRKGQDKAKKPSNGTVANLVTGTAVLRLKMKCDEVVKLRVNPAPAAAPAPASTGTEDDDSSSDPDATNEEDADDGCAAETDEAVADESEEADDDAGDDEGDETEVDDEEDVEDDVDPDDEEDDEEEEEEDPALVDEVVEELPL